MDTMSCFSWDNSILWMLNATLGQGRFTHEIGKGVSESESPRIRKLYGA